MHEISIAIAIIDIARDEAERHGAGRVSAVHVRVGPLVGVAREALLFSYGLASEGTIVEGARLVFQEGEGAELLVAALELEIVANERSRHEAPASAG